MKKNLLFLFAAVFCVVVCACQSSNGIKKEETVGIAAVEQEQKSMDKAEKVATKLSLEEQIQFVNASAEPVDIVDNSKYAQEREELIDSEEKLTQISDEFLKYAMEKADPETGRLDGIFLPVRAVFVIHSMEDVKKAESLFMEIGTSVSSFEVRLAKDFDASNACNMGCALSLNTSAIRRNRLVISGEGEKPVNVGKLKITLSSDVVELSNLMWDGVTYNQDFVSVVASELFAARKLIIVNSGNVQVNNGGSLGGMPSDPIMGGGMMGGVPAQPGPVSFISLQSDKKAAYLLENVYAENNQFRALVKIEDSSRGKFDRAVIQNVRMVDNRIQDGIDISVSDSVLIKNALSTDGEKAFKIVGTEPKVVND